MQKKISYEQLQNMYDELNNHLLHDSTPSKFLNSISMRPEFLEFPFDMLLQLKSTKQSPIYHPEGSVWNHTLLVIDEAAKRKAHSKNATVFMWAAMLHDIGKPASTKVRKGKITSYEHEKIGAIMARDFLSVFTDDTAFINDVSALVLYHMQMLFVINDLPFANIAEMQQNSDVVEIALLGLCDRVGRKGSVSSEEIKNMELFLKKCSAKKVPASTY
jgi:putative nucleotidyltransferase with HDIG domain